MAACLVAVRRRAAKRPLPCLISEFGARYRVYSLRYLKMDSEISASPEASRLPVLPLRDVVVYPHMVIPLFVGREKSVVALDRAMAAGKEILLVAQTQADVDEPEASDLHEIGTLATILQLLKLPDGTVKVLVEGVQRARLGSCRI